jgi:hypothetical protein
LNISFFDVLPTKVEIRKSIPKLQSEDKEKISSPSIDATINLVLKKDNQYQSKGRKGNSAHQIKN